MFFCGGWCDAMCMDIFSGVLFLFVKEIIEKGHIFVIQFNYHADKYFENVLETIRGIAITSLQMIDKPVDKTL
jgi:hypothetical protein